jgi:sugar lactone lactonase YvrE
MVVNTNTVSTGGMPFSSSATTSYSSLNPYKNIAASGVGIYTEYTNQAALPTSATIGMSGSMDTGTDYTDSTKTVVLDTFVETWSLLAGATPSTANLCTKIVYKAVAATATSGTLTGCLNIDSNGNILGLQLTTPIGLSMVTLHSTSIIKLPNAPTISSVTAGADSATVSLVPPVNSGGAAITSYTVTAIPSAPTLLGNITITGATSPITIGNLTAGVPYTFTATASNILGAGVASAASYAVTPTVGAGFYVVSTLAGSGVAGSANGTGTAASFFTPYGVAIDSSGNLYVSDSNNNQIRLITPAGVVSTFAGSGAIGSANGIGTAASFSHPTGIAVDSSGNVYVADTNNHLIRKITSAGLVSTLAGTGVIGHADGASSVATFYYPTGVAVDSSGSVYVSDTNNNEVRKISSTGAVSTLAGSPLSQGYVNGTGALASLNLPMGIAVDSNGNVYVSESGDIRVVTPAGVVSSLAGGIAAFTAPASGVLGISGPGGVAIDKNGNVYVAEIAANQIRVVSASGVVSIFAGSSMSGNGNINGVSSTATFNAPSGVAVDSSGNVYVTDQLNNQIRKISFVP